MRRLRGWLSHHARALAVLTLVGLALVIWAWWVTRRSGEDAMAVAECAGLYARATTSAESTGVDPVRPIQALSDTMTCGTLRARGRLP